MITGASDAADAFLFASLTALSASWPRREAGRGGTSELGAPPIRVTLEKSSRIRGSCVGGQGPQPPLLSTLVGVPGCAHACPSTWAPTSPSRRTHANHSPEQRHVLRPQLPSSRADRRRPRIKHLYRADRRRPCIRTETTVRHTKCGRMRGMVVGEGGRSSGVLL